MFLLFAGERFVPPEDRFGTGRDPDQAEKKLSHKLNLLTGRKWQNCVPFDKEAFCFNYLR